MKSESQDTFYFHKEIQTNWLYPHMKLLSGYIYSISLNFIYFNKEEYGCMHIIWNILRLESAYMHLDQFLSCYYKSTNLSGNHILTNKKTRTEEQKKKVWPGIINYIQSRAKN